MRCGWLIAELRGRSRRDPGLDGIPDLAYGISLPPLSSERTSGERLAQDGLLLETLSTTGADGSATDNRTFVEDFRAATPQGSGPFAAPELTSAWGVLDRWDAELLDQWAQGPPINSSAYDLGKALAEMYWTLEEEGPLSSSSWEFLYGPERVDAIELLLGRLGHLYSPTTCPAIASSLHAWHRIGTDPSLRTLPGTRQALREQLRCWHELLVMEVDPETMVKPYHALRSRTVLSQTLKSFSGEIALGFVSLFVLIGIVLAWPYLSKSDTGKSLIAIAGALGLSASAINGRIKSTTQSIKGRLKQDLYTDLLAESILSVPPGIDKNDLTDSMRARRVTAALPVA